MIRVEHLTIGQVAEQLGISEITVRRRIKKGKIKADLIKGEFGDQYFITSSELERQRVATTSIEVVELEKAITPARLQEFFQECLKLEINPLKEKINSLDESNKTFMKINNDLIKEIQELKEMVKEKEAEKKVGFWSKLFHS